MKDDTFCRTASDSRMDESKEWTIDWFEQWQRAIVGDRERSSASHRSERHVWFIWKLISLFQLTTAPTAVITSPINFIWFNFSGKKKRHTAPLAQKVSMQMKWLQRVIESDS